jgi:hypothetical protein
MVNRKGRKRQTIFHRKLRIEQHESHKKNHRGEEQVVPVPLVASVLLNIQSLERGNENEIVTTTNGTYPGSSVTQGIRYD